jgi:N-acetylglucosamine repressor
MLHQVGFGVKFIKDFNELRVLRFIKNNAPVSRAEIAKRHHISKAAVSDIIARLIDQGYVAEVGVGHSTNKGGRKPILLEFNQAAGSIFAVEIKRSYARVALLDMDAHIHALEEVHYPEGSNFDVVVNKIFPLIHQFMQIKWVRNSKSLGIGIGIPGLIDYHAGYVRVSDTLKNWVKVPIRELFEKEFNIKVILENDVKTLTLGECLFGGGRDHGNLVNLWIGDGIGAGIIINGLLLRGVTASAGEVGYDELGFFIRDSGEFPLLYKGQKDFGDILSNKLLLESACSAIHDGYKTQLNASNLNLETFIWAIEQEDSLAIALLSEYANILGILIINLVNTLNIELLILSGELAIKCPKLLHFVEQKVHKDILREPAQAVKIVPGCLKEKGIIMGATGLVLEDLFYQDTPNILKYRSIFK